MKDVDAIGTDRRPQYRHPESARGAKKRLGAVRSPPESEKSSGCAGWQSRYGGTCFATAHGHGGAGLRIPIARTVSQARITNLKGLAA
jgi:hypothetical protein